MILTKSVQKFCQSRPESIYFPYQRLLTRVYTGFTSFLAYPEEYKNAFCIDYKARGVPDTGYRCRNSSTSHDTKEIFHYRPDIYRSDIPPEVLQCFGPWLTDCYHLFSICQIYKNALGEELCKAFPAYNFSKLFNEGKHLDAIRMGRYAPENRPLVGKPHTDKNFFSLHLAETRPGLGFGSPDAKNPQPCHLPLNTAILFPADKAERVTNGAIKAVTHYGCDVSQDPAGRGYIVFFGNTP